LYQWSSIIVIIVWLLISYVYGFLKTRRGKRSVEEWFVAGRRLGLIVLWLSLGANIYSSYTFLGLPGLAACKGFEAFTIILYGMIGYLLGFWLIPLFWREARDRKWLTIADAFQDLYNSRIMGIYIALTTSLWSIPYIQLQLQGMGYIIETSSYGLIKQEIAVISSFIVLTILIVFGGMISVTSINALQGALMLLSIWLLGLIAPLILFGNYTELFNTLINASKINPDFHIIPSREDYLFLYTTILAAPLGFWLWPNRLHNIFAARDEKIVKKNMVLTSIFQLSQFPAVIVGLTATGLFIRGELASSLSEFRKIADKSFMEVAIRVFNNPLLIGLIGAGALAASLSTAAAILHTCASLFSKNIAANKSSEEKIMLYARLFTVIIGIISLLLALYSPGVLVYLLLIGYAGIIQLFPIYIVKLKKPEFINTQIAIISSATGMITALVFNITKPFPYIYDGFIGLLLNLTVMSIGIFIKYFKQLRVKNK